MAPLEPFTVRHFTKWAENLELEDGGTLTVEPFERRFIADLFTGVREAWLVIPEANGKTTLVAALALYHCRFRESAYVPVAASAQEQSLILFRQAEGFIRRTDDYLNDFELRPGVREIRCPATGGVIKAKAADERTGDGMIPTLAICDELHRHRDLSLYKVWSGKLGKRQPAGQLVAISTAGEPGSAFEVMRDTIRQGCTVARRRGAFTRAETPGKIVLHDYALPEAASPESMRDVKRANPFSRITAETLKEKRRSPTMTLEHWRRFTCNVPARSSSAAITEREWFQAGADSRIPEGAGVELGLDLGFVVDPTALVPLWTRDEDYRQFGPATILIPPEEGQLDTDEIKRAVLELRERNPILRVVMDISRGYDVRQWLEDELGLEVVERGSSNSAAVEDYEHFMSGLRNRVLWHSGDPGLTRHALNAVAKTLPYGDTRFSRGKDELKIDALVAAAMVHTVSVANDSSSVYDTRGLVAV